MNNIQESNLNELQKTKMKNNKTVEDNLVSLIAKIGEKITIRRANFFNNSSGVNFFYVHSALEKNIGASFKSIPNLFSFLPVVIFS